MNQKNQFSALITYQTVCWYILLVMFSGVVLVNLFGIPLPFDFGFYAAVVTLVVTYLKLVLIAEQFRKLRLQRYTMIAYSTFLILLIIVFLKVYL